MPESFFLAFAVLSGLCLGSFASALSYRLPRDLSILTQRRSACPSCGHSLTAADLIPFFSWVFLRGCCRYCRKPIGARYPLIEIATAFLCYVVYFLYGATPQTVLLFLLMPVIVSIIDIDLMYKIIPDSLNAAVLALGVAAFGIWVIQTGPEASMIFHQVLQSVGGAALYILFSLSLRYIFSRALRKEAMGLGDVKFFGAVGFWLGLSLDKAGAFMALSGILGIVLGFIWAKLRQEKEFPFGPALALAFVSVLFVFQPVFLVN